MLSFEEGNPCPCADCPGTLYYPKADNCSCHINPPCSACMDVVLACSEADRRKAMNLTDLTKWVEEVHELNPGAQVRLRPWGLGSRGLHIEVTWRVGFELKGLQRSISLECLENTEEVAHLGFFKMFTQDLKEKINGTGQEH